MFVQERDGYKDELVKFATLALLFWAVICIVPVEKPVELSYVGISLVLLDVAITSGIPYVTELETALVWIILLYFLYLSLKETFLAFLYLIKILT